MIDFANDTDQEDNITLLPIYTQIKIFTFLQTNYIAYFHWEKIFFNTYK